MVEGAILVMRPKNSAVDTQSLQLEYLQQPTYVKRVFLDLCKIHNINHCKGNTFAKRAKKAHENIPHEICKMFPDCCQGASVC